MNADKPEVSGQPVETAMMIVAADEGKDIRALMDLRIATCCHDCGARLLADSFTITALARIPEHRGKVVRFLCVRCLLKRKPAQATVLVDGLRLTAIRTAIEGKGHAE